MGKAETGCGFRVPPPQPAALLRWRKDFGTRFTIFVDTEEEFDWGAPLRRDARGTGHVAAIPAAHARFSDLGAALTYLVDHPIATDPGAAQALRRVIEDGRTAIGTQLHPWVNPPFEEDVNGFNSFAGNLPPALEEAKLTALTQAIEAGIGVRPRVYRAGRYGIGPSTLPILRRLGYRADTSMRSRYDYSAEGGPDFRAISSHAFHREGLLELPLTTVYTGRARRHGHGLYGVLRRIPRARGVASRLGLLSRVALTPEDMPIGDAMEAVSVAVGQGVRLLNFGFHSPSLEPGHTPYVRDAADLAAFHRWWERMIAHLLGLNVAPASLDEILAAADDACEPPVSSAIARDAGGL